MRNDTSIVSWLRITAIAASGILVLPARGQSPDKPDAVGPNPTHFPPPTAIYVKGNIYTMNAERPRAEAIAVAGDKIVAVGSNAEIRKLIQPETRINDLGGRTVLPGLIDAHGHVSGLGYFGLGAIDLSSAKSIDDVVAAVAEKLKTTRKGEWIVGGRWDHENWPGKRLPSHEKLSAISPDNPVWLRRVDGHAGLANAAAMLIARVTRETSTPSGGEIVKNERGEPTGVFVDNAESLISGHLHMPEMEPAAAVLKAQELCLSVGLTSVHDAGITPVDVELYTDLAYSGRLKLRVYAMMAGPNAIEWFRNNKPIIGDRFTLRSCKLYMDGAMGSRGAWLLEPYDDRPVDADGKPYTGLNVMPTEFIRMVSEDALQQGYQVCTHAIGDRANREVLNAYGLALSHHPRENHRFRIEHAQLLAPDDLPRFQKLGVIPSMQPTHCTSDMRWVYDRIGKKRAAGAYAWATLLRGGVRIAGGSDFPVESQNPFLGIYAAVTRQNTDGQPPGGWQPEQCMTRDEALRAFTLDAAYAAFEEEKKGSLALGKFADFIVIDRDIMTCPPSDIPATRVIKTFVAGECVFANTATAE